MVGYFPEGVSTDRRASAAESLTLVLQFGGASRSGYLSEAEFQQGIAELKETGIFERGVFKARKPDGGTRNQDAYEAVSEHMNGRELRYPESRYDKPVYAAGGRGRVRRHAPGVSRKHPAPSPKVHSRVSELSLTRRRSCRCRRTRSSSCSKDAAAPAREAGKRGPRSTAERRAAGARRAREPDPPDPTAEALSVHIQISRRRAASASARPAGRTAFRTRGRRPTRRARSPWSCLSRRAAASTPCAALRRAPGPGARPAGRGRQPSGQRRQHGHRHGRTRAGGRLDAAVRQRLPGHRIRASTATCATTR